MQKELLTVEFRYHDQPEDAPNGVCRKKPITIAIFDTLEEAIERSNKALGILSKTLPSSPGR